MDREPKPKPKPKPKTKANQQPTQTTAESAATSSLNLHTAPAGDALKPLRMGEICQTVRVNSVPRHVAVIMDGNGRWAKARGLPRNEGHRQGAETVRRVLAAARKCDVQMLTLFAFSVENWRRPEDEISGLWHLLDYFLEKHLVELAENDVRLHIIGDQAGLPEHVRNRVQDAVSRTAHATRYQCNVALNYGARTEVLEATREFARDAVDGRVSIESLDWNTFSQYLYTRNLPDPDLLIRTSGESRISNFLLLQLAYAELYFTPVLWPDFSEEDFVEAIRAYGQRERRFGLTGEQLAQPTTPA